MGVLWCGNGLQSHKKKCWTSNIKTAKYWTSFLMGIWCVSIPLMLSSVSRRSDESTLYHWWQSDQGTLDPEEGLVDNILRCKGHIPFLQFLDHRAILNQLLEQVHWKCLVHPSYRPVLAPCNFASLDHWWNTLKQKTSDMMLRWQLRYVLVGANTEINVWIILAIMWRNRGFVH
jgi:hypothetical protein